MVSAAMLPAKRLAGVTPSEDSIAHNQMMASTPALKSRTEVTTNPKQGHQWSSEKDYCPEKLNMFPLHVIHCKINFRDLTSKRT